MNTFEINLAGQILTVKLRLDNAFDIYEDTQKIGTLQAVIVANESKWISKDINGDYAKQIGELIDEHKMN